MGDVWKRLSIPLNLGIFRGIPCPLSLLETEVEKPMPMLCFTMPRGGVGGQLALSRDLLEREEEMPMPMHVLCYAMLYYIIFLILLVIVIVV